MKKLHILLCALLVFFLLAAPGCSDASLPPVYPYFSADTAKSPDVETSVTRISEHRVCLEIKNDNVDAFLMDTSFELFTAAGERVKADRQPLQSIGVFVSRPGETTKIYITLSNQYSRLAAGNYLLVKQIYDFYHPIDPAPTASDTVMLPTGGYVIGAFTLDEKMTPIDFQAEPHEGTEMTPALAVVDNSDLPLTAQVSDVTASGFTISYHNTSDEGIRVSDTYVIYASIDGEWLRVPYIIESVAYGLMYHAVAPGQTHTTNYKWDGWMGILPPGDYAFVQYVTPDSNELPRYEKTLAVEFSVE